jgi:hypothetical protein
VVGEPGRSPRGQPPHADASGPAGQDPADHGRLHAAAAQVGDQAAEDTGGHRQQAAGDALDPDAWTRQVGEPLALAAELRAAGVARTTRGPPGR